MATFTYNGHTYLLTDLLNWQDAETQAVSQGGHLATINDAAEQAALLTWLIADSPTAPAFWIGYTDQVIEGTFEWISGETSTYSNWDAPNEPNNAGGENYAQMFNNSGLWNDLNGTQLVRGIIEIPSITPPSDTTAPVIGGIAPPIHININDTETTTPFSTVTITDDSLVAGSISLDDATKGVFTAASLAASGFSTSVGGLYTHDTPVTAADLQAAIRMLVYQPTANHVAVGSTETSNFSISVGDTSGNIAATIIPIQVVSTSINDAPTLTTFATSVSTGNEDSEITVTFANLLTQGDKADVDVGDTVNAFVVKTVSSGLLKIGIDEATATEWSASNNTIDALHQAYWTPAANANGTLDAFTVVAKDNGGLESATPVQVTVDVAAVPDVTVVAGATPVEGGTTGTFLFTLDSPAPVGGLTVNYTLEGTATLTTDYTITGGANITAVTGSSFSIAAGQTSAVLNVNALSDSILDPNETVTINLTSGTDYQLAGSAVASLTITDIPTNTPPTVTAGTVTAFIEQTPITVANAIVVNDIDGDADWNGGILKVQITTNSTVDDSLLLSTTNNGGIWLDAGNVLMANTTVIGSADAAAISSSSAWTFTFNANASNALVQDTARAIQFTNNSDAPNTVDRTVTFTATDKNAGSASAIQTVSVTAVNDEPVGTDKIVTINANNSYIVTTADFGFSDLKDSPANAFLNVIVSSLPATTDGVYQLNGVDIAIGLSISVTDINAGKLAFIPATNKNGTGLGSLEFKVQDDGGIANGGIDTDTTANTLSFNIAADDNDILIGTYDNDVLDGLAGNDFIKGLAGDDIINGGTGADTMRGGNGDDSYYVDNIGDVVKEYKHKGEDTVYSTISYTLTPNVENLVLMGDSALNGTGNALDNHLTGNGAGSVLDGQGGDDNYYVDQSGDTIAESAHNGWDTVLSGIDYTLEDDLEELYLTGVANLNGTGNAQDNNLNGNAGDNILDGKAGEDFMVGHAGNDTYMVDNTGDEVKEYADEGIDTVQSNISYTLTANIENLLLTEADAINGTGNALDNQLMGNNANNSLFGGEGNDTLTGGNGADTLIGGHGQDNYNLDETTAATDTLRITKGDSLITGYDKAISFALGTGTISTAGVDRLDLESTHIAANTTGMTGIDFGVIQSISNGIISFDDANSYSDALAITDANLADVFGYLQANVTEHNTVAFVSEGNTYVFQDAGKNDTLVELVGVTAQSVSTSGLAADSVWIV